MKHITKIIFIIILSLVQFFAFALSDTELQEIVNVRRDFFNSDNDWDDFIGQDTKAIGKTGVHISVKHLIPHRMTKGQMKGLIDKLSGNDYSAKLLEDYYSENGGYYILNPLTDRNATGELAKVFKKFKMLDFDYAVSFYHDKQKSKTGAYSNFNYLFDYEQNLYQCRVNIQQDSRSYVLFESDRPNRCDLYLFGQLYQQDLIYYFPFDSLKYCEVGTILSMLRENKLYDEVIIQNDDATLKNKFIENVVLPSLNEYYTTDGGRSNIGEYVYIATGEVQTGKHPGFNCSGFMKEVCDNYIRYHNPDFKWMDINDLKERRLSERKNPSYDRYEETHDPFFGLDWIRNLCDELNKEFKFKSVRCEELNDDNRAENFGDFGYYFSDLQNVIFRDQQKDSRYIYLVSFNKYRDTRPTIPMFYHVAILVPIMQNGSFTIRLFESGVENPFDEKVKKLMPDKIHWRRFEQDIKDKISEQAELDVFKTVYSYNAQSGYYTFNRDAPLSSIQKARRILDELEFDKQKVYVCKVPLKM